MTSVPPDPVRSVAHLSWRSGRVSAGERAVPEETAVALTYNRASYAVMMATPADLEDFAVGFSLSERIVETPEDIVELDVVPHDDGIELRLWLEGKPAEALTLRRRYVAGPTGCGLCGIDSLAEAMRRAPRVTAYPSIPAEALRAAVSALPMAQPLNLRTRAVHAAAFWEPGRGLRALREDVGRHNALDKLAGALARGGIAAGQGAVLLTSRVSVEMVQKTAVMGAPIIMAVSAPTALAIRVAEAAGITLIGVARDDGFEVFTHPSRIILQATAHVA